MPTEQHPDDINQPHPQSLGEYRTGILFNPGGNERVNEIKLRASVLIDYVNSIPKPDDENTASEVARLKALAITHIEDAAMWAVKAATKPEAPRHFRL